MGNCNEIDVAGNQLRYPFVKAPYPEIQQCDCKKLVNISSDGELKNLYDTESSFKKGAIIVSGIGWALLGFVPTVGPFLSAAAGVANVMIPYMWPDLNDTPNPVPTEEHWTWKQIIDEINNEVNEAVIKMTNTKLSSIKNALEVYREAVSDWERDRDNEANRDRVLEQFRITQTILYTEMSAFQIQGYEDSLLGVFVMAATLYLGLLRDGIKFGASWGMSTESGDELDDTYNKFERLVNKYTEYCIYWYNKILHDKYQENMGKWNDYNNFRRTMTILVLDIVAIWPTLNPRRYELPIKGQLTRTIYTPMIGKPQKEEPHVLFDATIKSIEESVLPPLNLFSWLQEIDFFTKNPPTNYLYAGYIMKLKTTFGDSYKKQFGQGGNSTKIQIGESDSEVYKMTNVVLESDDTQLLTFDFNFSSSDCIRVPSSHFSENLPPTKTLINGLSCLKNVPCLSDEPCDLFSEGEICDEPAHYGHRLSWIGSWFDQYDYLYHTIYGWTHRSVDKNNLLDNKKITQIPAVKASETTGHVIKGPGSTGGDLVKLPVDSHMEINVTIPASDLPQTYFMRIRYASPDDNIIFFSESINGDYKQLDILATNYSGDLKYNNFDYATVSDIVAPASENEKVCTINLRNMSNNEFNYIIIDKIEFIPIQESLTFNQEDEILEKLSKMVDDLFATDKKNTLKLRVTDYHIDQVARQVECMSDKIYWQEKIVLLNQVKLAKRLSKSRNLLKYGDCNLISNSEWKKSNRVFVTSDNPIFKGECLEMLGASQLQFSNNFYPTYLYQKIEESNLKPYTQYIVRGFVERSKNLEILISRYDNEVHKKMNIPNYTSSINPYFNIYNEEQSAVNLRAYGDMIEMDDINNRERYQNSNEFEFYIDTGNLDMNQNLGIWIGFKIETLDGMAILNNLELIEADSLKGEALEHVKECEQKWKRKWIEEQIAIERAVHIAQDMIQRLFTSPYKDRLKRDTTLKNILEAEQSVKMIPHIYNQFLVDALPVVPGEAFNIFQKLSNEVKIARVLYEQRNMIVNGNFIKGLSNWCSTNGIEVEQIEGLSVLVIKDWSATISQQVSVKSEQRYMLRITARKEGNGEGYVTISDGTEENTETLKFIMQEEEINTMVSENCSGLFRYVTKIVEIFPKTDCIYIEIGETDGEFMVESIELID